MSWLDPLVTPLSTFFQKASVGLFETGTKMVMTGFKYLFPPLALWGSAIMLAGGIPVALNATASALHSVVLKVHALQISLPVQQVNNFFPLTEIVQMLSVLIGLKISVLGLKGVRMLIPGL